MFTGLVQAIGTIHRNGTSLLVSWERERGLTAPLSLGDSVAVDGVCLTVTRILPHGFHADVSPETLARTTLGAKAERRAAVNLEPALRLADRLGGHLVSGHIDGQGMVDAISQDGGAWRLEVSWQDPRYGRYICDKASVAINGISLTVAGCSGDGQRFWLAVIPHTWEHTTLQHLRSGDAVNLEADLLAKYAERLLKLPPATAIDQEGGSKRSPISEDWLHEHGWG